MCLLIIMKQKISYLQTLLKVFWQGISKHCPFQLLLALYYLPSGQCSQPYTKKSSDCCGSGCNIVSCHPGAVDVIGSLLDFMLQIAIPSWPLIRRIQQRYTQYLNDIFSEIYRLLIRASDCSVRTFPFSL